MTTKEEVYNYLTAILDSNSFEKNDKNKKISIKHKLTEEEMDGLVCHITNLLGQQILHDPDKKGFNHYKFNSHFINIDNNTIKIDENGRFYVDIDAFLSEDKVAQKILENTEFVNKIKSTFEPEEITIKFIIRKLLNNSFFLTSLVDLVTAIQKIEGNKEETLQQLLDQINTDSQVYEPEPEPEPEEEQNIEENTEQENTDDNEENEEESTIKYVCQFCNKEVSETDSVCPHCGAYLDIYRPIRL